MSVESVLSRVRSVIQSTLDMRASPEDEVEWECTIGMMQQDDGSVMPSINVYLKLSRLDRENCGIETSVFEPLPLDLCTNEFVGQWVDDAWDILVLRGLEVTIE